MVLFHLSQPLHIHFVRFKWSESYFKQIDNYHTRSEYQKFSEIPLVRGSDNKWRDDDGNEYTKECVQSIRVAEVRYNASKCFSSLARLADEPSHSWIPLKKECDHYVIFDLLGKRLYEQQRGDAKPQLKQGVYLLNQYTKHNDLLECSKITWR